jgi:cell division protein FtsW (lipid II flippase)
MIIFIIVIYFLFSPALQPTAGYGLLWLCSLALAMASCGSEAQRWLWLPVTLQPSADYGLLVQFS